MSILCLTGWQQPHDALAEIAPGAQHFDYAAYDDAEAMFAALPSMPKLAIGWSLGGQLLVRAIAGGYVKPEALLLLGAPFQWVEGSGIGQGIAANAASEAIENYRQAPEAMLKSLNALVALGDRDEKAILHTLNARLSVWQNGLFWLNELAHASCARLDFSGFPPTTIVHGVKDKVIYPVNAEAFAAAIFGAQLVLWKECAHAPHLHDAPALASLIGDHV